MEQIKNINNKLNIKIIEKNIFKFNNNSIQMKLDILLFKKYILTRLSDTTERQCINCLKNADYIEEIKNIYVCWYHGLLITKNC
jgi:hypothetical protein